MEPHAFFAAGSSCELRFERAADEWIVHLFRDGRRICPVFSVSDVTRAAMGVPDESVRDLLVATGVSVADHPGWNEVACRGRAVPFQHDGKDFEIWREVRNNASGATVYRDGVELGSTPDVPWPDGIGGDEEDEEAVEQARWLIRSGFRPTGRA